MPAPTLCPCSCLALYGNFRWSSHPPSTRQALYCLPEDLFQAGTGSAQPQLTCTPTLPHSQGPGLMGTLAGHSCPWGPALLPIPLPRPHRDMASS